MSKYKIIWSPEFNNELDNILHYLVFNLKEPMIAEKFYQKVLDSLAIIEHFPEGYSKLCINNIIYRRLFVDNYVIIYEVNRNTRTNFCFTYFSWQSKLFKSIIKLISNQFYS